MGVDRSRPKVARRAGAAKLFPERAWFRSPSGRAFRIALAPGPRLRTLQRSRTQGWEIQGRGMAAWTGRPTTRTETERPVRRPSARPRTPRRPPQALL